MNISQQVSEILSATTETNECLKFQLKRTIIQSAGIQPHNAYILDQIDTRRLLELFQLHAEGMPLSSIHAFLEYKYGFSQDTRALAGYWRRTQQFFKTAEKTYRNLKRQRRQQK